MATCIEVVIFGVSSQAQSCGCGPSCGPMDCGPTPTLKDIVDQLANVLDNKYGSAVNVRLVDILSIEIDNYPEIFKIIQDGRVKLPLTSINKLPRFQGGISAQLIDKAVAEVIEAES